MSLWFVKLLFWVPRILCLVFALFLVIFSFDIFEGNQTTSQILIGLFMHNIPTFLLLLALWLTWKYEWVGSIIYGILGILYLAFFWGRFATDVYFFISGPLIFLSIMYLINWIYRKNIRLRLSELKKPQA